MLALWFIPHIVHNMVFTKDPLKHFGCYKMEYGVSVLLAFGGQRTGMHRIVLHDKEISDPKFQQHCG